MLLLVYFVSESPVVRTLASQVTKRITNGLRPSTLASYTATFKLFLAFVIYCGLSSICHMDTVVLYLEYLAQNNLKACSLRNHIAVLKHFFALFDWPVQVLVSRKVQLMIKSVQMNAPLQVSFLQSCLRNLSEKQTYIAMVVYSRHCFWSRSIVSSGLLRCFRLLLPCLTELNSQL